MMYLAVAVSTFLLSALTLIAQVAIFPSLLADTEIAWVAVQSRMRTFKDLSERANLQLSALRAESNRLKRATQTCGPPETGSPGPPGDDGEDGEVGEDGDDGQPGRSAADILGERNEKCIICPTGPRGPPGPPGLRGPTGAKGIKGPPGDPGIDGKDGDVGLEGPVGFNGTAGRPGARGADGKSAFGGTGAPGPMGMPGPIGMTGPQGSRGSRNYVYGPMGPDGKPGSNGLDGLQGHFGKRGDRGEPGEPGTNAKFCPCPAELKFGKKKVDAHTDDNSGASISEVEKTPKTDQAFASKTAQFGGFPALPVVIEQLQPASSSQTVGSTLSHPAPERALLRGTFANFLEPAAIRTGSEKERNSSPIPTLNFFVQPAGNTAGTVDKGSQLHQFPTSSGSAEKSSPHEDDHGQNEALKSQPQGGIETLFPVGNQLGSDLENEVSAVVADVESVVQREKEDRFHSAESSGNGNNQSLSPGTESSAQPVSLPSSTQIPSSPGEELSIATKVDPEEKISKRGPVSIAEEDIIVRRAHMLNNQSEFTLPPTLPTVVPSPEVDSEDRRDSGSGRTSGSVENNQVHSDVMGHHSDEMTHSSREMTNPHSGEMVQHGGEMAHHSASGDGDRLIAANRTHKLHSVRNLHTADIGIGELNNQDEDGPSKDGHPRESAVEDTVEDQTVDGQENMEVNQDTSQSYEYDRRESSASIGHERGRIAAVPLDKSDNTRDGDASQSTQDLRASDFSSIVRPLDSYGRRPNQAEDGEPSGSGGREGHQVRQSTINFGVDSTDELHSHKSTVESSEHRQLTSSSFEETAEGRSGGGEDDPHKREIAVATSSSPRIIVTGYPEETAAPTKRRFFYVTKRPRHDIKLRPLGRHEYVRPQ